MLGEQVYHGTMAGKITVQPDDTFTYDQNRVDIQLSGLVARRRRAR